MLIHPTATVSSTAELGPGVIIGPRVLIGDGVRIGAYSCIGGHPEHRDFFNREDEIGVVVQDGARIFEFVTIHSGTVRPTYIGAGAAIFNHSHIAHDCEVSDNAIVGGHCTLAGFVSVLSHAQVSGRSAIHQRGVLGAYAFLGGASFLKGCIPPGELWVGSPARPAGENEVGLRRAGLTFDQVTERFAMEYDIIRKQVGV